MLVIFLTSLCMCLYVYVRMRARACVDMNVEILVIWSCTIVAISHVYEYMYALTCLW